MTRSIRQYRETATIRDRRDEGLRQRFGRVYTKAEIGLLAEVDTTLGHMCGHATRVVMRRQYQEYDDEHFSRLAGLLNGHLHNLRRSTTCVRRNAVFRKTKTTRVLFGERQKPDPGGCPGYLRVDTVHQGNRDGGRRACTTSMTSTRSPNGSRWRRCGRSPSADSCR